MTARQPTAMNGERRRSSMCCCALSGHKQKPRYRLSAFESDVTAD